MMFSTVTFKIVRGEDWQNMLRRTLGPMIFVLRKRKVQIH